MEFSLPLPENLAKDGMIMRQWNNFYQRFQYHKNTSSPQNPLMKITSVLLYASCHEINSVCETMDLFGMDLLKLNKILETIEELCLPRFILLFERFRYFTLEQDTSESLNNFINILRKQVELCEFGKIKDSVMTSMLLNGVSDETCRQSVQNSEGLCFDDVVSLCSGNMSSLKESTSGEAGLLESNIQKAAKQKRTKGQESYENSMFMVPIYDSINDEVTNDDADDHVVETILNVSKKRTKMKKKKQKKVKTSADDLKPFLCFKCDNEYAHRKSFRRHIASKHFDCKDFFCKHCRKTFRTRTECITHCRGHTTGPSEVVHAWKDAPDLEFLCWYCDEIFLNLQEYKKHSEMHTAVRVFSCELCQKKNHTITRMIGHLKGHLNPRHKCEICANCFSKPELLQAHLQVHAEHPVHHCQVCGKSFVTADRLQGHMRCHSGEKRFTCELCGRSFSQKVSFDYHKRWHAGEKPYECDVCGRRTRSFGDLRKHKRMHSDKRPYVCEVCGKSFRFISNLNRHRKGHSGKRSFACNVCGRTFIYGEGLRDHIKASRCPGRKKEGETEKASRARAPHIVTLHPQYSSDCNPINYATSHRTTEAVFNEFPPPWQYMLRNPETDGASNLVVMSPFQ